MEELKLLVELVGSLPSMALWVLAGFFVYKISVIGSIYGLIRFSIDKLHNWLTRPKPRTEKEALYMVGSITIDSCMDSLLVQLSRLKGKNILISSEYIHSPSVAWLCKAIDAQEATDRKAKETK